jgi:tRNA G18 (ribose-2'-O)-methylase SpoU
MEAFPFRAAATSRPYREIRRLPATVVLDRVRSLYNVGAFFRSADAAGISKIHLTGYTGHPPHPGISKTALGAEDTVAWQHTWDPLPLLSELRGGGHEIAALETTTEAVDLYDWCPRFPVAIVFGNEVDGVASEIADLADVHVRIPMLGLKQSLNVAVAGGVVLFELLRKYRRLHEAAR